MQPAPAHSNIPVVALPTHDAHRRSEHLNMPTALFCSSARIKVATSLERAPPIRHRVSTKRLGVPLASIRTHPSKTLQIAPGTRNTTAVNSQIFSSVSHGEGCVGRRAQSILAQRPNGQLTQDIVGLGEPRHIFPLRPSTILPRGDICRDELVMLPITPPTCYRLRAHERVLSFDGLYWH